MTTQLNTLEHADISKLAFEYLTKLLHKISLREVARLMRTRPVTLYRWLDEDKPLESISIIAASYIVLMCETNKQIQTILDRAPRNNAYYQRSTNQ